MNKRSGGNRAPRRAAALAVAAAVAVLAAACGGAAPSSASPPTYAQELALAQCMRGHGVPNFPDPQASGGYSLGSNGSIRGCRGVNRHQQQPGTGGVRPLPASAARRPVCLAAGAEGAGGAATAGQELPALVKYAQCMRSHGVPNFPDPAWRSERPASGKGAGLNPSSPQFQAAVRACQHVLPAGAHLSIKTSAETHRS